VVLVEVVELVIDINGLLHVFSDDEGERARRRIRPAVLVVFFKLNLLDFVAHNIEDNAEAQEDQAKNGKDYHRGAKTRDRTPCRQHLLLETGGAKLFNFLFDLLSLFFGDIHNLFE